MFLRDFAKMRDLGRAHGFVIVKSKVGLVTLLAAPPLRGVKTSPAPQTADALRAVFDALGAVVSTELSGVDLSAAPSDRFLRIAAPRLVGGSEVAHVYATLRTAWSRNAKVRFRYPRASSAPASATLDEREVEPHIVTYYEGRYYLVAFDPRPATRNWRQFALDRIAGPIAFAGTFRPKLVPAQYRGDDAVGLFKTGPKRTVTVALSALVARSVTARSWQRGQKTTIHDDGSAEIVLEVFDVGEAVRWAFGFGAEAEVVDPPEAVAYAGRLLEAMASGGRTVPRRTRTA